MTLQKKEIAAPANEPIDEIDAIMSEIEQLQQSMSNSQAAPGSKPLSGSKPVQVPSAFEEEPNVMEEFNAASGDAPMEETLSELKDDEPTGPNLIDQAMEAEAAQKEDEAPGQYEADPFDEELAQRELDTAVQDAQADKQEEETPMPETPRRGRPEVKLNSNLGSVSLKLEGDMMLRLSYEYEGQEVTIGFSDGALRVELSDGTEFKIPVRRNSLRKAA